MICTNMLQASEVHTPLIKEAFMGFLIQIITEKVVTEK